uniref:Uncharacterized protein n=1 Tax=Octopus bimaculoides TaxID=37653 RepID=A0A0L8FXB8_OCTBM
MKRARKFSSSASNSSRLLVDKVHLVRFCSGVKRQGTHLAKTFENPSSFVTMLSVLSVEMPSLLAI